MLLICPSDGTDVQARQGVEGRLEEVEAQAARLSELSDKFRNVQRTLGGPARGTLLRR